MKDSLPITAGVRCNVHFGDDNVRFSYVGSPDDRTITVKVDLPGLTYSGATLFFSIERARRFAAELEAYANELDPPKMMRGYADLVGDTK